MLRIGGYFNIVAGILHIVTLPWSEELLSLFEVDRAAAQLHQYGQWLPVAIAVVVILGFIIMGLYGLSGAGVIRRLPLLRLGVFAVASVYLLRAFTGLGSDIYRATLGDFSLQLLITSLIALAVGLLYLLGGIKRWPTAASCGL